MDLLNIIKLEALFIMALLLPLLLQLVLLYAIGRALWGFTGRYYGRLIWRALALVGVPVHEASHALAFLLTGAGLRRVVLFAPRGLPEYDGATGVVVPAREPSTLSRLAASIAPFFGCSLAAWGVLSLLLPGFSVQQLTLSLDLADLESVSLLPVLGQTVGDYLRGLVGAFAHLDWSNWRTYLAIYLGASLGMGAPPSAEDFKRFFPALLTVLIILLPVFALLQTFGEPQTVFMAVQQTVGHGLFAISAALSYATVFAGLVLAGLVLLLPLRR